MQERLAELEEHEAQLGAWKGRFKAAASQQLSEREAALQEREEALDQQMSALDSRQTALADKEASAAQQHQKVASKCQHLSAHAASVCPSALDKRTLDAI